MIIRIDEGVIKENTQSTSSKALLNCSKVVRLVFIYRLCWEADNNVDVLHQDGIQALI